MCGSCDRPGRPSGLLQFRPRGAAVSPRPAPRSCGRASHHRVWGVPLTHRRSVMPALNVVMLVGNLTRDPEVRYSPTGTPVATLGLAVNTRVKGQDGQWRDDPCFIDVVVFGNQAEACGEYLEKGAPALVEGRLQYRTWEDSHGNRRSEHEA